jgi:hypothetical protein
MCNRDIGKTGWRLIVAARKVEKVAQFILLMVVAGTLLLWPYVETYFSSLSIQQLLGVLVGVFASSFLYFDSRLSEIQSSEILGFEHLNLIQAVNDTTKRLPYVRRMRVYALSSGMIQPLVASSKLEIDECTVLVRGFTDEELKIDSYRNYNSHIEDMIREWEKLRQRGRIKTLTVKRFFFAPTEYHIIFDESYLILGLLKPDPGSWSTVAVEEPVLVRNVNQITDSLVRKYISRFEHMAAHWSS